MLQHPFNVLNKVDFHKQVNRDPVSIGGLIATAIGGWATTAVGTFLITTAVYVGITAITTWAVNALTPKPKNTQNGLQVNKKEAIGAGEIVYGTIRKGGNITFMQTSGDDNKYLYYTIVLACHQVEDITDIYVDNKIVTLDASGFVTSSPWNSKIQIVKKLGVTPQGVWSVFSSGTTVGANFRGDGIAYLGVRLEFDEDVFTNGMPLITAVVKGKKVYDPRTATTGYTANAALCIRDYLTNSSYGVGSPSSEIDDATFITAANACDEAVSKAAGGTETRYEINGVLSTADRPRDNIDKMLTACAGSIYWGQGLWRVKVGKWTNIVDTFTLDDFRSEISLTSKVSARDNFNTVKGTFINKEHDYIQCDYPKYASSTFITQDGGESNVLDLELPLTVSPQTAQRLAKLTLYRSREQAVVQASFSLKAMQIAPGDNIGLTIAKYGWTNKAFEVMDWQLRLNDGLETVVDMTLKETSVAAYNWTAEEQNIINNDTNLPDVRTGTTVTGLTVTNDSELDEDGTWKTGIALDWNVAASAFVSYYDVQYKRSTASRWAKTISKDNSITLYGLNANKAYDYRVRCVTLGGFKGAWTTLSNQTSGKKTANPAAPTGLTVTPYVQRLLVEWNNPTDKDLKGVQVWVSVDNILANASRVTTTLAESYSRNYNVVQTRYFWVRSVDQTGNFSAYVGPVSGTTRQVQTGDIDDGAVTQAVNQHGGSGTTGTTIPSAFYGDLGSATITRNGGKLSIVWTVELGESSASNNPQLQCRIRKLIGGTPTDLVFWKFDYRGQDRTLMTYAFTDTDNDVGNVTYKIQAQTRSSSTGTPQFFETNGAFLETYK